MRVVESQFSVKFQSISQLSANFADFRSRLSVRKRVISRLTVKILASSQLSVKLHPEPSGAVLLFVEYEESKDGNTVPSIK